MSLGHGDHEVHFPQDADMKVWLLEEGGSEPSVSSPLPNSVASTSSPAPTATQGDSPIAPIVAVEPTEPEPQLPLLLPIGGSNAERLPFCRSSPVAVLRKNKTRSWRLPKTKSVVDVLLLRDQASSLDQRELVQPKAHRLPGVLMWTIVLLTATGIAGLNFFSLLAIEYCMKWKFQVMQDFIDAFGVSYGMMVLVAMSVGFAICGVSIILLFAPNAGGSGLPESKCYLNGSPEIPNFFTWRNLVARIFTSIFANAAGFPVGREGPTVTIGTNLAYLISDKLAMPFVQQRIDLKKDVSTFIVEEERFAHATRINCAVGGACAMAMLFNSPIGGLLYMFEEISPASWPIELTFRAFVATTICTLVSYFLLGLVNQEIRDFVIFAWLPQNKEWTMLDIPVFVVMSAFLGAVTSYHTRIMLEVARLRKCWQDKWIWKKCGVATETVLYCCFCALLCGVMSLFGHCREIGQSGLQYVRFNCAEGEYNPVASLLVTTSHSSVKLLFSGANEGEIPGLSSAIAFVTYFFLNVCLAGLPVPGGAFTATMLLGGLFGRGVGAVMRMMGYRTAVTGVYAVVGASAMLCGFKQMAAAVVLIVVQCVNDFNMTPIVMLSVSIALKVNQTINERGHDEEQIERKGLPFLEPEMPPALDDCVAMDLLEDISDDAKLAPMCTARHVEAALGAAGGRIMEFPVLEDGRCVGTISRAILTAALQAVKRDDAPTNPFMPCTEKTPTRRADALMIARINSGFSVTPASKEMLPLERIMDPTPFTIGEEMPAARFYALFAKAGETVAIVVSRDGDFLGMITRRGLIDIARKLGGHR